MATEAEIEKVKKAHYLELANHHDLTLDDVEDMSFDEMTETVHRQQDEYYAKASKNALKRHNEWVLELVEKLRKEPPWEMHMALGSEPDIETGAGTGKTQTALDFMNEAETEDEEKNEPRYRCGECGTEGTIAPGIGPYCPNLECEVGDGPGLIEIEEDDATHIEGIEDGAGCVETWDHLSEEKDGEVDESSDQPTAKITGYDETLIECPCGEYCDIMYIDAGEPVDCGCGRVFELTVSNEPGDSEFEDGEWP